MAETQTPIAVLRLALDRLERHGYEGYEDANALARKALAEVEAVVAAFRTMDKEYRKVLGLGDEFQDAALAPFGDRP